MSRPLTAFASFVRTLLFCLVIAAITPPNVFASIIGDTLTFRRAYPTESTDFSSPVSTTVTADSSDLVTLQPPFWNIDPGVSNIFIDVQASSSMLGIATVFDGIVITGFSETITNATFTTSDPAFVFGLSFDESSIALNLTGPFDASDFIDITVETASVATIPEPTTLAIWSLLGAIGLVVGHRRRRRKAA